MNQLLAALSSAPGLPPAQAFDTVCARFPPVMHHFFLESFRDPGGCFFDWLVAIWCSTNVGIQHEKQTGGRKSTRKSRAAARTANVATPSSPVPPSHHHTSPAPRRHLV